MPYKFEIYKDNKDGFRFRFMAPNGRIMFASECYKNKPSAMKTIGSLKKNVVEAKVDDKSPA